MGKKYKNPPVVEALCEFQSVTNRQWDLTIPDLIYEKVKDSFPVKQQRSGLGIHFISTKGGFEHRIEPAPPLIQLLKADKTALIQIAPDLFVVNQLKPYHAWENFKAMIIQNFNVYKEVADPRSFKGVHLRYINIFEFDEPEIRLEEYFQFYPFIPQALPQTHISFSTRVEFPSEDGTELLTLGLASMGQTESATVRILLDIDNAMLKPESVSLDYISKWLDDAHERLENAFENSITDNLRKKFEEVR